jgi:hypothetical protein
MDIPFEGSSYEQQFSYAVSELKPYPVSELPSPFWIDAVFIEECRPGRVHFHHYSCFSSVPSTVHHPSISPEPLFFVVNPVGIHRASDLHSDTLPTNPSCTTTPLTKEQTLNQLH